MHRPLVWLALLAFVGLPGCATRIAAFRPAPLTARQLNQAGFSPAELTTIDRNCYKGMPRPDPAWPHGPTRFIVRDGYVLQHSTLGKIALWVCEGVSAQQLTGSAPRKDLFRPDDKLPVGERAELADYKGTGYDRGHMAPAGNQTIDRKLKEETFYLSNMAPQLGALNQQIWKELEDETRKWVATRGTVYEVTGGFFYDPAEDDVATADGIIHYFEIGKNRVAVPTHFFKILIAKDAAGKDQAIAFVLENKAYPRPFRFGDHIRSIRWIEEHTGLDFFPDLEPAESQRLERNAAVLWQ